MAQQQRRPFRPVRQEEPYRINERIRVPQVRMVGENVPQGIFDIQQALKMAEEQNLDLVEISPNAVPPVCKVIDYSKFKYEQKKKQKEIKANAQKVVIKEIRFSPTTDDHDYDFKLKHALNFLKEGAKVKAYVQFSGREIVFKDQGYKLLERFAKALEEVGKVELEPKLEGKRMSMILTPKALKK
ncbi:MULTISPECIES: translation initiation factor IF-3 [Runella]|uniref:Translation initiation factor IF-3 n=1 Tax=Runella defluvii TaxID=370973 RepID=A0A7W6EQ35_9BACT|nr:MULTISPECIES: translation initiation factor IF-3 [Runella]AYQ32279.1 translation initiation factor IF-3 [Runella sp. SP2]MBB3837992.1 translation initiation factor IF-3 [Runella defluvii]MCA0233393.1 translation initiation factor IF-3 [Bacteroidota bacterium]HAO48320.1 translation initiation factor IF-3 [Runella sp.]